MIITLTRRLRQVEQPLLGPLYTMLNAPDAVASLVLFSCVGVKRRNSSAASILVAPMTTDYFFFFQLCKKPLLLI
jgi:hypothetical protein